MSAQTTASARGSQRPWFEYLADPSWLGKYPLLWAAIAIIGGGKLNQALSFQGGGFLAVLWLAACVCLVATVLLLRSRRVRQATVCGWLTLAGLGALISAYERVPVGDDLMRTARRQSQPLLFRAEITSAAVWQPNPNYRPERADSCAWRTRWHVRVVQIRDGFSWRPAHAQSTLSTEGRVDEYLPGDVVQVYGSYRRIPDPTNPGAFDFAGHSGRQGRFVWLMADSVAQMQRVEEPGWRPWARARGWAVSQIDRHLRRWVTFGQAPLAAALVFGQREQVDWEDQQQLMATGTLHMLAISGLHVEIVAWGVILLCSLLAVRDRWRLVSVIVMCGLYAGLADGKPPVLRAAILVAAFEVARCMGRRGRLGNLLSLAAIVLYLIHTSHVDNVGVHLSFLAVAAIGIFANGRDTSESRSPMQRVIREGLGPWARMVDLAVRHMLSGLRLSFWVWLVTCPMVWYHFHVVAPIAVPLNVLMAVPLTVSLLAGMLTAVFGWVAPLGWCAGQVCGAGLALICWLVDVGEQIPFGHCWLPSPPLWWILVFYGLICGWLLFLGGHRRRELACALVVWLMLGLGLFAFGPTGYWPAARSSDAAVGPVKQAQLKVTFLDVGHGTSVLMQLPDGRVWMYDAGHLGISQRSHQQIAAALWDIGVARIDTLILSHADADHYNATAGLVERFEVGRVVSTAQFWQHGARDVQHLIQNLRQRKIPCVTWSVGDSGRLGDFRWRVLHPQASIRRESDNANSLCLELEYQGKRVLLPGDLEGSGLLNLMDLPARPCHVLMAPHHGSLSSDPELMLRWCQPSFIVISGNQRAARPAVEQAYRWPGAKLGITFRDGALQYRVDDQGQHSCWHWSGQQWRFLSATEEGPPTSDSP